MKRWMLSILCALACACGSKGSDVDEAISAWWPIFWPQGISIKLLKKLGIYLGGGKYDLPKISALATELIDCAKFSKSNQAVPSTTLGPSTKAVLANGADGEALLGK